MIRILPAIDLIEGQCVRLYQGEFSSSSKVADDPETQLLQFINSGAEMIHIVDLDGARAGIPVQFETIKYLCSRSAVPVEVGGGIRSIETINRYIDAGVSRLVLGTAAIENEALLKEALNSYADKIAIGIDAKGGKVATRGWESITETDYVNFTKRMEDLGAQTIIFTDISKDGTMSGPNFEAYKELQETVSCNIVASGGIRDMQDLIALNEIGITEAIVGKAVYEGRVTLGVKKP
jgi:phosphoribosylformimino-5-aminoimidazole carboxamide ribotide isomerase